MPKFRLPFKIGTDIDADSYRPHSQNGKQYYDFYAGAPEQLVGRIPRDDLTGPPERQPGAAPGATEG